jgi:ABC-type branched-subunit amino acid transport system ATPase component
LATKSGVSDEPFDSPSLTIIEHQPDLVLSLADKAYVLVRRFISHEGPAKPLSTDPEFRKKVLCL